VRATRLNHVSIHAVDMEASLRFYTELFGLERIPSPTFQHRVEWLRLGDQQLHLFERDTEAPSFHHIAFEVDDFEAVCTRVRALGVEEGEAWSPSLRELPDGSGQMYLRDPAGNLVEVDWPDVSTLDRSVVGEISRLEDDVPQSPDADGATLYLSQAQTAR